MADLRESEMRWTFRLGYTITLSYYCTVLQYFVVYLVYKFLDNGANYS